MAVHTKPLTQYSCTCKRTDTVLAPTIASLCAQVTDILDDFGVVVVRVAQPRERGIILVECFGSSDLGLMVFSFKNVRSAKFSIQEFTQ